MHGYRNILRRNAKYPIIFSKFRSNWCKPDGYDTRIQIYNCVAKEKVPFIVRNKNFVTWYTCGPTVYDSAHMGHASCYIKLDIIQRILVNYFGLNLVTCMNITDVDDKIIKKSQQLQKPCAEVAAVFEEEFWMDLKSLNIKQPNIVLKVSEHIPSIQKFIQKLLNENKAYLADDCSVYFDTSLFNNYGKLQNISEDTRSSSSLKKKSSIDFALWKAAKSGEPYWVSDFGKGRPGWHIECSALASSVFGSTVDVHAGGLDLRFPHHENEETQCCSYYNKKQWVNYWIHAGQLHLKQSEKMSKSLKNTVKIQDFVQTHTSDVFRIACLLSHYRNHMEFSDELLENAENVFKTYKSFIHQVKTFIKTGVKPQIDETVLFETLTTVMLKIDEALKDDFDTAQVMKGLNHLVNVANKLLNSSPLQTVSDKDNINQIAALLAVSNYITNVFNMFGVELMQKLSENQLQNASSNPSEFIDILVNVRQRLRAFALSNKDQNILSLCDDVRDDLKKRGVVVNDYGNKSNWTM